MLEATPQNLAPNKIWLDTFGFEGVSCQIFVGLDFGLKWPYGRPRVLKNDHDEAYKLLVLTDRPSYVYVKKTKQDMQDHRAEGTRCCQDVAGHADSDVEASSFSAALGKQKRQAVYTEGCACFGNPLHRVCLWYFMPPGHTHKSSGCVSRIVTCDGTRTLLLVLVYSTFSWFKSGFVKLRRRVLHQQQHPAVQTQPTKRPKAKEQ